MATSKKNKDKKIGTGKNMLEEIKSQPEIAKLILEVYFRFGTKQLNLPLLGSLEKKMAKAGRVLFLGCGTSYHAGLYGRYLFNETVGMPAACEFADEFAKLKPRIDKNTLVVGLSQSGETGDLIEAMRKAGKVGADTLALVNKRDSSLEKVVEGSLYLEAGEEKALAATKSYTAELVMIYLLALRMIELRTGKIAPLRLRKYIWELPDALRGSLKTEAQIKKLAKQVAKYGYLPVLGERFGYPAALEGALKIKEISYLNAQGYPTGEYRHGPVAMTDKGGYSLFLSSADDKWEATDEVVEAVKKAKGKAVVLTDRKEIKDLSADKKIHLPHVHEALFPMIMAVPLQLMAFHLAKERGVDIDKPRHLHKYVA